MKLPPYKFVVLFFLYVAQAIPQTFFQTAVPVYLRQREVELAQLGFLAIAALPAALRFLWAPLVDAHGIQRMGNYKSWIIPLQVITVLSMPLMTTFDWVANFWLFFALVFVMTFVGSTQDTGVDGLVIRALTREERPTGMALSNFSVLIGMALGGGIMIWLFERLGLNGSLWVMAGVYAVPLLFLIPYKEPPLPPDRKPATYGALITIFKRPEVRRWLTMQTLLLAGIALAAGTMMIPMLVDQGYQMAEFGVLNGMILPAVGAVGTMTAPWVIRRFGRKKTILFAAALLSLHVVDLIVIHTLQPPHLVSFGLIAFMGFTNVYLFIGIYSVAMDLSRPESAGTDWTVQSGILVMTSLTFGFIASLIAQRFGYLALLSVGLVISLAGFLTVLYRFREEPAPAPAPEPIAAVPLDSVT